MNTLYIMQGVPGSGKSTIACELADLVFSTDDFFYREGEYKFDAAKIGEAHQWNQLRAEGAMMVGGNDIAIDNTNVKRWEAKPYVQMAERYGYAVVFVRVSSNFKSVHGVTQEVIERMKTNMENLSVEGCLSAEKPMPKDNKQESGKLTGMTFGMKIGRD